MHLIDILMKKTKSSQFLSVYFSFLFSYILFISQCSFANSTLNLGKRQEKGRVSNRCFSMKNYTTVILFLLLLLFFVLEHFFFPLY
jgi:MFS-type transporter involved in bile tolerance (Atg22 family)